MQDLTYTTLQPTNMYIHTLHSHILIYSNKIKQQNKTYSNWNKIKFAYSGGICTLKVIAGQTLNSVGKSNQKTYMLRFLPR